MRGLLVLLLLGCFLLPAAAAGVVGTLEEELGADKLSRAAEEYLDGYLDLEDMAPGDFAAGAQSILEQGGAQAGSALRGALGSGVALLTVCLLCGLTRQVGDTLGDDQGLDPARLAGAAAIAAIAAADVHTLMGLGRAALEELQGFSSLLLPVVTAACAAAGTPVSAAARQSATLMFLTLLLALTNSLLTPLVYGYVAASVGHAAVDCQGLSRLAALLKWAVTGLLSGLVTVFVLYLSVTGAVSGNADALAQKAARTAISGMVPVVGGILSDASETVVAGAGVLKGSVGVVGLLAVLGVCFAPFLRLGCHYLVYKLTAALAATVTPGPLSGLIDAVGSAFALELGMTGTGAAILYIAIITSIKAVSP